MFKFSLVRARDGLVVHVPDVGDHGDPRRPGVVLLLGVLVAVRVVHLEGVGDQADAARRKKEKGKSSEERLDTERPSGLSKSSYILALYQVPTYVLRISHS